MIKSNIKSAANSTVAKRRQQELIERLSLALLVGGTIIAIFWVYFNPDFIAASYIAAGLFTVLLAAYGISRTRWFVVTAYILTYMVVAVVVVTMVTAPGDLPSRAPALNFLIVAILLASLLLSRQATVVVSIVCLLLTLFFFFTPEIPFAYAYSMLVFFALSAVLFIVDMTIRDSYWQQLLLSQQRNQVLLSDMQAAYTALQKSENRFRQLTIYSPDVIVTISLQSGGISFINQEVIFGYSNVEIDNVQLLANLIHEADFGKAREYWHNILSDRYDGRTGIELRLICKNGDLEWTYARAIVLSIDQEQSPLELLVTLTNITERKMTEEALHEAEEQMRHLHKLESLGVMAGGIAHDFNNLLVAMISQTSLALMKLPHESPSKRHLEKAASAAERAAQLTKQLLAYTGRGRFEVRPVNLTHLVNDNYGLLTATTSPHVTIELQLAADLPFISVDPTQIQQIMLNLVINANEAIEADNGQITIETGSIELVADSTMSYQFVLPPASFGRHVYLQVSDNGSGVTAENLAKIFDPFFTTKETGHGLGLAATMGIVKGHRGCLAVESEVGTGTTFWLFLPAMAQTMTPDNGSPITSSEAKIV